MDTARQPKMKKTFLLLSAMTLFTIIGSHLLFPQLSYGQKTLQFSTFTPEVVVPPTGANSECTQAAAEGWIARYRNAGISQVLENASVALLSCDIYRYERGCTDATNEDCTRPCVYIKNGPTAEQIQSYPGVSENIADFHTQSSTMYPDSYLYTKAVGRFDLRNGFGLTTKGKQESFATLSAMTCAERNGHLTHHISTPLYFYPEKTSELSVKLPDATVYKIISYPQGYFTYNTQNYSSLSYDISSVVPQASREHKIISQKTLQLDLGNIADELKFTPREKEDFVSYWSTTLPKASFYEVSLLTQNEARKAAPWTVTPKPKSEIRYIFTFRPLVEKNPKADVKFHPLERNGFTVVDIGGVILW